MTPSTDSAGGATALLDEHTVLDYLATRGLPTAPHATAVPLGGGVSNVVLRVATLSGDVVVKQALPRLRVVEQWSAKRERTRAEAAALALAGRLTPGFLPRVIDTDPQACAVVIEAAPEIWRDWKTTLLTGVSDPAIAATLGRLLASWHARTHEDPDLVQPFCDLQPFEELRLDPYYHHTAERLPRLKGALLGLADSLRGRQRCLVHGDFSPKNVLVGSAGLWVIDFEVAHYGDPAFDLAFMTTHLVMKAVHRSEAHAGYAGCAEALWSSYRPAVPAGLGIDEGYVLRHVGALLLARVYGKSPAEYLTTPEQATVARLGEQLLTSRGATLPDTWALVRQATTPTPPDTTAGPGAAAPTTDSNHET
jgi:tRNA A-37 threonylcarbamoyl transferase component Bud32